MLLRLMLLLFPFSSLFFISFALTLSVNAGKEAGENYSTIHIKESLSFKCVSDIDDFDVITQVQCVFPREPKEKFEPIKTSFFHIDSFTKDKKYYIRVLPQEKIRLFPIANKLYEVSSIRSADTHKESKHWMLVGYKNRLPLIKIDERPKMGLNFPLTMEEIKLPSVGALDISGNPISSDQVKDVADYMRIKAAYEAGNYDQLVSDVDALFMRFPNTIFRAELLLYKIRGHHKSDENEALIEVSKEFFREYSDDEGMAEVLAYTANAYSAVGIQADGAYFYERLFKEFGESKYAALGMVFLGDQYLSSGKSKEAGSYFEKALYMTSDVEVASMAAIRLAKMSQEQGDLDKASELYIKIIEGNGKYLVHNINQNYDNARAFANRGHQKTAAAILKAIVNHIPASDDRYEAMIKDIGLWLAETEDKPAAYMALKSYKDKYGDSEYTAEVQEALDSLFYTPEDANTSALIAEYESLQEKYPDQEIGNKAGLQKAKILYDTKQYQGVIDMEGTGAENESGYFELKNSAALALALETLEKGECSKAISLSQEYNLSIESKFDDNLYACAFKTGNYTLAKSIAIKHIKDSEKRLSWLYAYAKTLNKTGEYEELTKVAEDVITLSDIDKTDQYDDILQDTFYAYERLKNTQGMIKSIKELEKRRGLENDDIELYVSMVKLGLKQNDDIIIETYTKKVMTLQDKTKSYSQSPFVEFAALQVMKAQKKEKEQLELLSKLVKLDLKEKEQSRVQYMLGSLLMKGGKTAEAKTAFEASIKADETSAWAGLSKDALGLL